MDGLMMDIPLTVPSPLLFAARHHGDTEIVSCTWISGEPATAMPMRRANRLSNALCGLGIERGDRVGTIAFNDHRHFELYHAVPALGATYD